LLIGVLRVVVLVLILILVVRVIGLIGTLVGIGLRALGRRRGRILGFLNQLVEVLDDVALNLSGDVAGVFLAEVLLAGLHVLAQARHQLLGFLQLFLDLFQVLALLFRELPVARLLLRVAVGLFHRIGLLFVRRLFVVAGADAERDGKQEDERGD